MAVNQEREFKFTSVELRKTEALGTGGYGAVCKAKCDDLVCAAKIMHRLLFQFNDPGTQVLLRKFEQECEFLSRIRHPNVIQYLGTHRDPDTGLPVLLMELMDESLTHYLERMQEPVPFYIQVNICHDISLAVAFLHTNGIIHRDLSGNNVLMIGDKRAKVTDFGVSKLADVNPRITPLTVCPGTMVYMSPEALKEPPVYSEKLDCFSMGVLIIQILAKLFPKPSDRLTTLHVADPRHPNRLIEVQAPIPEIERRQNHIELIDPNHLLLPIALECLNDDSKNRPSSHELCDRFETMKTTPDYIESEQQGSSEQLQQQLAEKETQIEDFEREKTDLQKTVNNLEKFLKDKDSIIEMKDQIIRAKEEEIQQYKENFKNVISKISWRRVNDAPEKIGSGSSAVIGNNAYFSNDETGMVYQYNVDEERWSALKHCGKAEFTLVNVEDQLVSFRGYALPNVDGGKPITQWCDKEEQWIETNWYSRSIAAHFVRPVVAYKRNAKKLFVIGGGDYTVHVRDISTQESEWSEVGQSLNYSRCSSHVFEDEIYLVSPYDDLGASTSTAIIPSTCKPSNWCDGRTSERSHFKCGSATVKGTVLTIGGSTHYKEGIPTSDVQKFDWKNGRWEKISEMNVARADCLVAVLPNDKIVVVGGHVGEGVKEKCSIVEIGTVY